MKAKVLILISDRWLALNSARSCDVHVTGLRSAFIDDLTRSVLPRGLVPSAERFSRDVSVLAGPSWLSPEAALLTGRELGQLISV